MATVQSRIKESRLPKVGKLSPGSYLFMGVLRYDLPGAMPVYYRKLTPVLVEWDGYRTRLTVREASGDRRKAYLHCWTGMFNKQPKKKG